MFKAPYLPVSLYFRSTTYLWIEWLLWETLHYFSSGFLSFNVLILKKRAELYGQIDFKILNYLKKILNNSTNAAQRGILFFTTI